MNGYCPRCGEGEHCTMVESLACVEVNGATDRIWDATADRRAAMHADHDPTWLAALGQARRLRRARCAA